MNFYKKWIMRGIFAMAVVGLAVWGLGTKKPELPKAKAGEISSITVSPSNTSTSTLADYTIGFTTSSNLEQYGYVYLVFRGNDWGYFDTYNATLSYINVGGSATDKLEKSYFSGNNLAFQVPSGKTLSAGSVVEIKITSIRNPYYAGGYQLQIYTNRYGTDIDGSYSSRQYMSGTFTIGTIRLHGTVSYSGSGVSGTYLSVYSSNYSNYGYANTNSSGYYELGDSLAAGSYTLTVSPPWDRQDLKRYTETVSITSEDQLYNITLEAKTKTLSGRVTGSDGSSINNAYLYASQPGTWDYAYAQTDSSGNYSMKLGGGEWAVNLSSSWEGNWVWDGGSQTIKFASDQTSETQSLNFTVTIPDCTVSGSFVYLDSSGNEMALSDAGVSIYQTSAPWSGFYRYTTSGSNTFSGKLIPGKFKIYPWSSNSSYYLAGVYRQAADGSWTQLGSQVLTVDQSDTSIVVKIVYSQKTDYISGSVQDENGAGIAGVGVYGWKSGASYDWANATTDASGNYSLLVSPGDWNVNAYPSWNSNYTYLGKPRQVTVVSGTPSTGQNFSFMTLNATVNGTVVDSNGAIISTLNSWAYLDASEMGQEYWYSNVGASVVSGKFSMKVPAGSHKVTVGWGGSDYTPGDPTAVTIAAGETQEITVTMLANDATVTGYLKDTDGNAVTGKYAWISATNNRRGWSSGSVDTATGQYTLRLAAGTWFLSYWVDYSSGYASQLMDDNKVTIASGQTIVKDITLRKIDSQITGTVKKYDGTAMENVAVSFDTRAGKKREQKNNWWYYNNAWTDNEGNFSINVPAGTYYVGATIPYWQQSSENLINPERAEVTVNASTPGSVNLIFRQVDSQISGTVYYNGSATSGYIWAWAEKGGSSEANTNSAGQYQTNATKNDLWHIGAVKESSQTVYRSNEYLVETGDNSSVTQDLVLRESSWALPDSISATFDPTKQKTITLSDGTVLNIPANALVSDPSNPPSSITLTATPSAALPYQKGNKPLWYGYDFSVTEPDGTTISNFSSDIIITFPFTEEILAEMGLTEDDLTLKYYNETTGEWEQISNVIIDRDNNTITISVDHFTIFAITTDVADTTAPSAPTNQSATASNGRITLGWTNPTDSDLAGIKIYRSTSSGTRGDLLTTLNSTSTTSYINTGLTNGTTYYYTIRAIDRSANESANNNQVSARPDSSSEAIALPATGMAEENLWDRLCAWLYLCRLLP